MNDWLRKGARTADGRQIFAVCTANGSEWICCDPLILERSSKDLSIPGPGDPPADDGYQTPWELRIKGPEST